MILSKRILVRWYLPIKFDFSFSGVVVVIINPITYPLSMEMANNQIIKNNC